MSDARPAPAPTCPRQASHGAGLLFLAVTCVGWALNWPAIKILLREWPPLFSRGVAGLAAALLLVLVARALRADLRVPRPIWPALIAAAFTNVFAWMGFGTIAMNDLSIAEASLLAYTMPIWATLFAWPLLGTRPTVRDGLGVVLGASGLILLFAGQPVALGPDKLFGIAMAVLAAVLFAFGSVMAKGPLPVPPITSVTWQVGLGCLPMVLIGWAFERPQLGALSLIGFADLIYMAVGPMALCYLSWFAALKRLPASTATTGTLTVPIVGISAGALVLGDPLGWREAAAGALTLAGVALTLQGKTK
jgi:drug/metabolite transporter (DMT)-like permease